ncbi:MAG: UvrD-helicase domain-containing protein [Lentisphaerae bacterium]|nr:UvrD-helicase domain-containing protein [Lentisphaerota bacterium]
MNGTRDVDKYGAARRQRQKYVDAVVATTTRNKIVVAGPGTGKTYLFRQVLAGKKNTLTLTFVNALVEDLALELFGLSDVRTLHGFARQQLKKVTQNAVKVFPKLSAVIRQDHEVLRGGDVDFNALFHNKPDADEHIEFYRKRRMYYGHYGFSDMVYAAVRLFEERPDTIPAYSQVVVDEFQDFNALEVSLIELLSSKSPVLLAGDDDQALYENLKSASTEHIRQRHGEATSEYQSFTLPYCSRSTRVIVDATNDVISGAIKSGCLRGRIEKPFRYFDDPQKDKESERNPQLVYSQVYAKQIPWFIQERVKEIAKEVKGKFTVLLISPTRTQMRQVVSALREKGFENVPPVKKQENDEPTLLEGLNLLLEDDASNLGWRVVARAILPDAKFRSLLLETADTDSSRRLLDILAPESKKEVRALLKTLRAVRDGKCPGNEKQVADFLKLLGVDALGMATECLRDHVKSSTQRLVDHGIRKVFMKATTIPSAKGLAADHVFITHFDDRYFIKDRDKSRVTDQDICSFLVALTRARRKVFLISSDTNRMPTFLKWIDQARIHIVKCNLRQKRGPKERMEHD